MSEEKKVTEEECQCPISIERGEKVTEGCSLYPKCIAGKKKVTEEEPLYSQYKTKRGEKIEPDNVTLWGQV
ncbi:hypothetical protein H8S33_08685 [Ornithinibacillus sp. BX22]|uniref:Uncharacterized protein n=1 Tax=Ornithinibacillus hominis TaxID=2763055 RepID=A0A923RI21_9BACI|nr:hypothetical protein [Ornithinibacillus hominis]MBC5636891.1 hypothetical protein [Ornithinibacillus hominis]